MANIDVSKLASRERPVDLPDFSQPPLIEVVLGVQFSELRDYRTNHAGLLWKKFRKEFPTCTEHQQLDTTFETFGVSTPTQPELQIVAVPGPRVPRLWFINRSETELIQFQSDRFLHNWRRVDGKSGYRRYEPIRADFFEELATVQSFLEEEKIGSIEPNQCEITYVNHIDVSGETDPSVRLRKIFKFWNKVGSEPIKGGRESLPTCEDVRFSVRFVISDPETGKPQGRLHVQADPAVTRDNTPIVRLNLTARGNPVSPTLQGVAEFLDIGREAIVRGFAAITTDEMQKRWERVK